MSDDRTPTFDLRVLVDAEANLDEGFKQQVQSDPRAAVRALADKYRLDLPDIDYRVAEDRQGTYTIVLSPSPAGPAPEQLESEVQGYVAMFTEASSGLGGGTVGGKCTTITLCCHSPVCTAVMACRPITSLY